MHKAETDISPKPVSGGTTAGQLRVLIAAGGTGGHVYPAIAIADALQAEYADSEILFVGTKDHMEWETVPRAGYDITSIWISGFHRRLTAKNLLFPVKLGTSLVQSLRIINKFKPDVVVSCGGYAAGPVGWVAAKKGVPLVVQEQNSFPGVTNRLLGKSAERIFTAFEEAENFFPKGKIVLAGNPTRNSLTEANQQQALQAFNFDEKHATLLILGGSGGAKSINEAMKRHITSLHDDQQLQIIWQCGQRYYDRLREDIDPAKYDNLILTDFLHNMPEAYAAADLVISRAGALSCSELALTGKPSILVPSPNVAGDHQTKNAQSMVHEGAAELAKDDELDETLAELVDTLINDQQRLQKMQQAALTLARPEAAQTIAKEIITLIQTDSKR
ncbi:undecaprenyldiphospho-muramoylpentapeptide beta-N-acetylglucosaminyltransferase [Fodinibius salsisoli]|uniref:UDP-N-acetylglucosamine--N-acetylmuramyl-(pentapeptide) pyrophosphoryl-undecaprenol N-acetylglucosamine transferase n=1 Tax=Fodinibius salsisoli TaxID=2820877 RepID=A0ABT3PNT6_9BACT|nr:undecaprenyldiphospho-muramoylpentapeptide beta-N-acetylglucosaminyltransferase [Fodinibius salsisoli]MCW9707508.1 undecaprenyldiphospho-muramoylpentapeptide beta-N-acetylglucosaminyltransferase [Fodinibius salsisoli]